MRREKGRALAAEDLARYKAIVAALVKTAELTGVLEVGEEK